MVSSGRTIVDNIVDDVRSKRVNAIGLALAIFVIDGSEFEHALR